MFGLNLASGKIRIYRSQNQQFRETSFGESHFRDQILRNPQHLCIAQQVIIYI